MKHTRKTALTAAILTAAVSLAACNGEPSSVQTEYGPPPAYEPSTEEIQDVYGPPPTIEEEPSVVTTMIDILPEAATTEAVSDISTDTTTKPIDVQFVYGPPSAVDD